MLGIQNYWMRKTREQEQIDESIEGLKGKSSEVLQRYVSRVETQLRNRSLVCEIWQLYSAPIKYIAARRILEEKG